MGEHAHEQHSAVQVRGDAAAEPQGAGRGVGRSERASADPVPRFLALWQNGKLDFEGMISHRRPIEDINEGLDDMRAGRGIRTVLSF